MLKLKLMVCLSKVWLNYCCLFCIAFMRMIKVAMLWPGDGWVSFSLQLSHPCLVPLRMWRVQTNQGKFNSISKLIKAIIWRLFVKRSRCYYSKTAKRGVIVLWMNLICASIPLFSRKNRNCKETRRKWMNFLALFLFETIWRGCRSLR